jgi:D-glycero-D-manno-heptose 1,7-bisphosphate phosphatase
MTPLQPALFLDRDGVIIHNRDGYVRSWEDVAIYPAALTALARLAPRPLAIVLITNQAGVGHGLIPLATAWEINRRLTEVVEAAGGRLDAVYLCPHRPDEGCSCRKPAPGLILQAAHDLGLDLGRATVIGDALSDLGAGWAAGVARVALVETGRGAQQASLPEAAHLPPFPRFPDLSAALDALYP